MKKIKRKIRRKRGSGPRNMYFTMETQEHIVQYQNSEDPEQKKEIYIKGIQPAFDKLVENLIFVYGFNSPYDSFQDLKTDCVSFLYESLHKWSPEKGTKAFSYYNVVAKNWLIIKSRQQTKRVKRHISSDNPDGMTARQRHLYESSQIMPSPDEILISRGRKEVIQDLLKEIAGIVTSETEKTCISAVQTVFANVDNLDFLNKRAAVSYTHLRAHET